MEREAEAEAPEQYETLTAKFHFVDLAGSERLKRTGESLTTGLSYTRISPPRLNSLYLSTDGRTPPLEAP